MPSLTSLGNRQIRAKPGPPQLVPRASACLPHPTGNFPPGRRSTNRSLRDSPLPWISSDPLCHILPPDFGQKLLGGRCPPPILFFPQFLNLQWPSRFRLVSFPPRSCPKCPQSVPFSPPSTSTPSVGGGGVGKGRSRKGGWGNKNSKPTTKKQDQERRKKKKQQPKSKKLWGKFNKKKKTKTKKPKRSVFGKKGKKKKVLCTFSKFCGETSRYWALFSKISKFFNLLQICVSASDRLFFFGNRSDVSIVSSICQLEIFFLTGVLFQIKIVFSNVTFHKFQNSPNFCQTKHFIQFFVFLFFFSLTFQFLFSLYFHHV